MMQQHTHRRPSFYHHHDHPTQHKTRLDFRDHRIFTIDPTTAKDLDDALHIIDLGDGTVEVREMVNDTSERASKTKPINEANPIRLTYPK